MRGERYEPFGLELPHRFSQWNSADTQVTGQLLLKELLSLADFSGYDPASQLDRNLLRRRLPLKDLPLSRQNT